MNDAIFYFFYNFSHRTDLFDQIIIFYAVYFPYLVMLSAGVFLLFHRRSPREFLEVFISSISAWVLSKLLKIVIHIPRAFDVLPGIKTLFSETGYGFPSGHATFFAALAVALFIYHKKTGYLFMFFALIIGIARIAAGVHSPFDILGGFILGALIGPGVAFLLKKI